jgi:hypothetical protein
MTKSPEIIIAFLLLLVFCKEKNKMENFSIFPPKPYIIPFTKDEVVQLFPVLRTNGIGMVYDEQWTFATIQGQDINLDKFPLGEFQCSTCKSIIHDKSNKVFVKSNIGLHVLDWTIKKKVAEFYDISKSVGIGLDISKMIDCEKNIAVSMFNYDGKDQKIHRSFVIDDILNKKRLK